MVPLLDAPRVVDDFSVGRKVDLPQQCDYIPDRFQAACYDDFDVVIHLAASVGEAPCEARPRGAIDNNVRGLFELTETLKRCKTPPHLVFASSLVVYGNAQAPFTETQAHDPLNTYAWTKCAGEHIVRLSGLSHTVLRFANVYGLGRICRESSLTGKYAVHMAIGKELPVWGDGSQRVDMVHVRDVARACRYFAAKRIGGTFNVGSGTQRTVLDVARTFAAVGRQLGLTQSDDAPVAFPRPDFTVPHDRTVDVDFARDAGWAASESFPNAVRELIIRSMEDQRAH